MTTAFQNRALRAWQRASLSAVRAGAIDLSSRQQAILITVYLEPPPTVSELSQRFGIPKPAVSRAIDAMGAAKLVRRVRDETDRRVVKVYRTDEGALFVQAFALAIVDALSAEGFGGGE